MRKGMIDKIFSMVLTIVIVLVLGIVLYTTVFSGQASAQARARLTYEQEYTDLMIKSMLNSHEQDTGYTYESLIALSLQELQTVVEIKGQQVDVEQEFITILDSLVGQNNYYLEIKPQVKGVSITYILDGSPTMADKREEVNSELPTLEERLAELFKDAEIITRVYVLSSESNSNGCADFSTGIECQDLDGEEMYGFLSLRGYSPPIPKPYLSYSEWLASSHAASTTFMSESDWASATAYASFKYIESEEPMVTNKHVIVVVADELASSSKADVCLSIPRDQWGNDELFICSLCDNNCPFNRSSPLVAQAKEVLEENDDLFLGFYSLPCAYDYQESLGSIRKTPFVCRYLPIGSCSDARDPRAAASKGWINDPAGVNWCNQATCGGCTRPTSFDGTHYCYHSACNQAIIQNLTALSAASGGSTHDLTDLDQLTEEVYQYFSDQSANYEFAIGTKDDTRDRFVVEHPFTLSNGRTIMITFWIYD